MSDLEGAPLALAVAKAMGKESVREYDGSVFIGYIATYELFTTPGEWIAEEEWRPDQGGAAGAEVLEWARANIYQITLEMMAAHGSEWAWRSGPDVPWEYSEADDVWIALCRAVVAWREQRC